MPPWLPSSTSFFALSQAPPELARKTAISAPVPIAPAVVRFGYGEDANAWARAGIAVLALLVVGVSVWVSKRRPVTVA